MEPLDERHDEPADEDAELIRNVELLLYRVAGDPRPCRGCGALIYLVRHANGKMTPYTSRALNHFIDCPDPKQFRRNR